MSGSTPTTSLADEILGRLEEAEVTNASVAGWELQV
jgi:hypothetical protein